MNRLVDPFKSLTVVASMLLLSLSLPANEANGQSAPPRPPSKSGSSSAKPLAPPPPRDTAPSTTQEQTKPTQTQPTQTQPADQAAASPRDLQIVIFKELGVSSAYDLDGVALCLTSEVMDAEQEESLLAFFKSNGMAFEPVHLDSLDEVHFTYVTQACDAFVAPAPVVENFIKGVTNAGDHQHAVLPERIN